MGNKSQLITLPFKATGIAQIKKDIDKLAESVGRVSLSEEDIKRIKPLQDEIDDLQEKLKNLSVGKLDDEKFLASMKIIDENFEAICKDIAEMKSSILELGQNAGLTHITEQFKDISLAADGAKTSIKNLYDEMVNYAGVVKETKPVTRKDFVVKEDKSQPDYMKKYEKLFRENKKKQDKIIERINNDPNAHKVEEELIKLFKEDNTSAIEEYIEKRNKQNGNADKQADNIKKLNDGTNALTQSSKEANKELKEQKQDIKDAKKEAEELLKVYKDVYDAQKKALRKRAYTLDENKVKAIKSQQHDTKAERLREQAIKDVTNQSLKDLNTAIEEYEHIRDSKIDSNNKMEVAKKQVELYKKATYIDSLIAKTVEQVPLFDIIDNFPEEKVNVILDQMSNLETKIISVSNQAAKMMVTTADNTKKVTNSLKVTETLDTNEEKKERKRKQEKEEEEDENQYVSKRQKITLYIPDDTASKLKKQIRDVIDVITNPPIQIPVELKLVSGYKSKQKDELLDVLKDRLDEVKQATTDGEVKASIDDVKQRLDKALASVDASFHIDSNIKELRDAIDKGITDITNIVGGVDLQANIVIDKEKIEQKLKQLGKFKLEIEELTFGGDLIKSLTAAEELIKKKKDLDTKNLDDDEKEVLTKEEEMEKKIRTLVDNAFKVAKLIKSLKEQIGVIPLNVDVKFNEQQIKADLKNIQGLAVKVSELVFDDNASLAVSGLTIDATGEEGVNIVAKGNVNPKGSKGDGNQKTKDETPKQQNNNDVKQTTEKISSKITEEAIKKAQKKYKEQENLNVFKTQNEANLELIKKAKETAEKTYKKQEQALKKQEKQKPSNNVTEPKWIEQERKNYQAQKDLKVFKTQNNIGVRMSDITFSKEMDQLFKNITFQGDSIERTEENLERLDDFLNEFLRAGGNSTPAKSLLKFAESALLSYEDTSLLENRMRDLLKTDRSFDLQKDYKAIVKTKSGFGKKPQNLMNVQKLIRDLVSFGVNQSADTTVSALLPKISPRNRNIINQLIAEQYPNYVDLREDTSIDSSKLAFNPRYQKTKRSIEREVRRHTQIDDDLIKKETAVSPLQNVMNLLHELDVIYARLGVQTEKYLSDAKILDNMAGDKSRSSAEEKSQRLNKIKSDKTRQTKIGKYTNRLMTDPKFGKYKSAEARRESVEEQVYNEILHLSDKDFESLMNDQTFSSSLNGLRAFNKRKVSKAQLRADRDKIVGRQFDEKIGNLTSIIQSKNEAKLGMFWDEDVYKQAIEELTDLIFKYNPDIKLRGKAGDNTISDFGAQYNLPKEVLENLKDSIKNKRAKLKEAKGNYYTDEEFKKITEAIKEMLRTGMDFEEALEQITAETNAQAQAKVDVTQKADIEKKTSYFKEKHEVNAKADKAKKKLATKKMSAEEKAQRQELYDKYDEKFLKPVRDIFDEAIKEVPVQSFSSISNLSKDDQITYYEKRLEKAKKLIDKVTAYQKKVKKDAKKDISFQEALNDIFSFGSSVESNRLSDVSRFSDYVSTYEEDARQLNALLDERKKTSQKAKQQADDINWLALSDDQAKEINTIVNKLKLDKTGKITNAKANSAVIEELLNTLVAYTTDEKGNQIGKISTDELRRVIGLNLVEDEYQNGARRLFIEKRNESSARRESITQQLKRMPDANSQEYKALEAERKTLLEDEESYDRIIAGYIKKRQESYENFFTSLEGRIVPASEQAQAEMEKVGENLVEGDIKGIKNKTPEANKAVEDLKKGEIDTAKKAQDSHSPSKEMEPVGEDFVSGDIKGIKNKTEEANQAVKDLVDEEYKTYKDRAKELYKEQSGNSVFSTENVINSETTQNAKTKARRQYEDQMKLSVFNIEKTQLDSIEKVKDAQIEADKEIQRNRERTQNSPRIDLTDEYANPIKFYRGVNSIGAGVISSETFSGSFWTNRPELGSHYASAGPLGKLFESNLAMKNPLEVNARGSSWDEIIYLTANLKKELEELSKIAEKLPEYGQSPEQYQGKRWSIINDNQQARDYDLHGMFENLGLRDFDKYAYDNFVNAETIAIQKMTGEEQRVAQALLEEFKTRWSAFVERITGPNREGGMFTTEELTQYAIRNGYGGLIMNNLKDGDDKPGTVVVSYDEQDIKNLGQGPAIKYLSQQNAVDALYDYIDNYIYFKRRDPDSLKDYDFSQSESQMMMIEDEWANGIVNHTRADVLRFYNALSDGLKDEIDTLAKKFDVVKFDERDGLISSLGKKIYQEITGNILDSVGDAAQEAKDSESGEPWWIKQSKENYKKTNDVIQKIKGNPNSHSVSPEMMESIQSGAFNKNENLQAYINSIPTKKDSSTWKRQAKNLKLVDNIAKELYLSPFSQVDNGINAFAELYGLTEENTAILRERYEKLEKSLGRYTQSIDDSINKGLGGEADKSNSISRYWYKNYARDRESQMQDFDNLMQRDIESYTREGGGDISSLKGIQTLEEQYIGYIDSMMRMADKDSRQFYKDWMNFAKQRFAEQKQVLEQKEQLAKDEANLIEQETEAEERAREALEERDNRIADSEAKAYAEKQADEFDADRMFSENEWYYQERERLLKEGREQEAKIIAENKQYIADFKESLRLKEQEDNLQRQETNRVQKQLDLLEQDLNNIMGKTRNGESFYAPEVIQKAQYYANNLNAENSNDIKGFISDVTRNNPTMIRGNASKLLDFLTNAERLRERNNTDEDFRMRVGNYIKGVEELSKQSFISEDAVNRVGDALKELQRESQKLKGNFFSEIGVQLNHLNAKFIATYFSFHDIIRYVRSAISTITDLDTALTEMRKVSDESLESLKEYQKTTFDTASALGTTAVQIQQSTADWLRLGESMEEASKSAVAATTLLNVSEFENINQATEALVSMSQAYKDLDKTEIIDVLNNIGNNYSIATDQLATALQASSAALVTQGNDLYEAAALVTAGNAIIQDASKVGTGIRTISLRIAGVKEGDDDIREELEELGEEVDDWVVSTEAKKRQVIMDYTKVASNNGKGVDILDSNGNLKDTYTILLEISKIYKEIQEEDKKYGTNRAKGLVEELAGKVRSNIAASILMNPELLENVYESAKDSAGSAAEENAKYLDSIVGKTQQFKNEVQELESYALDSELIKDVIDFGTTMVSVVNQLGDKLPVLIALIGTLAVALRGVKKPLANMISYDQQAGVLNTGNFVGSKFLGKQLNQYLGNTMTYGYMNNINGQDVFQSVNFDGKTKEQLTSLFNSPAYQEFMQSHQRMGSRVSSVFYDMNKETLKFTKDTEVLLEKGVYDWDSYGEAMKIAGQESQVAGTKMAVLNSVLSTGAMILISLVSTAVIAGVRKLANASDDATQSALEFADQIRSLRKELKGNKDFVDEIGEEYDKLSKGVDNLGNNISLSTNEFARYNEISQDIADRFPQMITGYSDEGKVIVSLTEDVKSLNEEYEKYRQNKLAEAISDKKYGSAFADIYEAEHANVFEQIIASFTGSKEMGKAYDAEYLQKFYKAFLDMSYEEFTESYKKGTQNSKQFEWNNKYAISAQDLLGISGSATKAEWGVAVQDAMASLQTVTSGMDTKYQGVRDDAQLYFEYALSIDDRQINKNNEVAISSIIDAMDEDLISSFGKQINTGSAEGDLIANWLTGNKKKQITEMKEYVNFVKSEMSNLNSDALGELFIGDVQDKNYAETRKELLDAYDVLSKQIDDKIARTADETEKEWLRSIKGSLWEQSGAKAYFDLGVQFDNSLNQITKNGKELDKLNDYTKNFSQKQMQLWMEATRGATSATTAITMYEDKLKAIKYYKFDNIGSLLSQSTSLDSAFDERLKILQEEYDKELNLAKQAGAQLDQTLYGNIDLNNRGVLEWNTENLEKYKDAIESYGDSIESYAGSISTVDAMSSEFDGVEIAFSPILQTPNGPEFLDKDTVYKYINELVNQMPEGWTDADLFALDAQGIEIEGQKIKGLVAAVGDEAIRVGKTMHYLGPDGSLALIQKQMDELKSSSISWEDVKEDLIGLAQAGKLDETTLKEYKYFDEILKALGIDADDAEDSLSAMIDAINKMANQNAVDILSNYRTEVDKLDDAYQKYLNNDFIDANTLSALQDAFGDLDSYQEFEEAVMSGEKELQQYFDNIVTEYAIQNTALAELTEENKEWVKQQLVASGITKESAEESVEAALKKKQTIENEVRTEIEAMNTEVALKKGRDDLAVSTENLNNLTATEIAELMKEAEASGNAAQEVALFTLKKELANGKSLRNPDDIDYLKDLIILCGIGADKIAHLKDLARRSEQAVASRQKVNDFLKANPNQSSWNPSQQAQYHSLVTQAEMDEGASDALDKNVKSIQQEFDDMFAQYDYTTEVNFDYSGAVDSAKDAGSAAGEAFKDSLDKILAMYDAELDAGVITFQTYVDKSRAIIEQYYKDGKITAQEYYDELADFYGKQVSQYDKVISAVQKKLSDETDALEKEKENIEKSYNEQIEVIQKKIDALQDENDEIDRNMELSKAQYELARARNQRTRLMYSETRGFYYEADLKGISDAEENVRKAKMNKQIAEYEKQIKSLQDSMESETKSIDDQIKKLNEYSEAWGKVSTQLEDAQNALRATEVLGPDWETNILNGLTLLEQFTNDYVGAQQRQKEAYLEARRAEVENPVGGSGDAGQSSTTPTTTPNPDSVPTPKSGGEYSNPQADKATTGKGYKYNGKTYATVTEAQAQKQADVNGAAQTAYLDYLNSHGYNPSAPYASQKHLLEQAEKEKQKAFNEANKKQITALYTGTDSAQRGEALVGELKPEIIVHKNGTASIVDEPTLMDLQGGEKIFNGDETEKILKSKYKPLSSVNPKKFAMLHAFAGGTTSPMQRMIAAQAVGIASGIKSGIVSTSTVGGQTINQTFNVTLPNITDASKATDLMREFQQMSMKATQYFKRRD